MTVIDDLWVELRANVSTLTADVNKANTVLSSIDKTAEQTNKNMTASFFKGTLAAGAFFAAVGFVKDTMKKYALEALDAAKQLKDLSVSTDISIVKLSRMQFVAQQTGVSFEGLISSIQRVEVKIGEATEATGNARFAFLELGLAAKDLAKLTPDKAFDAIVKSLHGIKNSSDQARLASEIFGRQWKELAPIIKTSTEELQNLEKQAPSPFTDAEVKKVNDFKEAVEKLNLTIRNETIKTLADVSDSLVSFTNTMTKWTEASFALLRKALDFLGSHKLEITAALVGWTPEELQKKNKEAKEREDKKDKAKDKGHSTSSSGKPKPVITVTADTKPAEKVLSKFEETVQEVMEGIKRTIKTNNETWSDSFATNILETKDAWKSLGMYIDQIANDIAKSILKTTITGPLTDSFVKLFFPPVAGATPSPRAEGGTVATNRSYLVGERGPELFTPAGAGGTILSNSKLSGGSGISIVQNFNITSGAEVNLIDQKIKNAAPVIAAHAQAGIFSALKSGGPGAKLLGRRL